MAIRSITVTKHRSCGPTNMLNCKSYRFNNSMSAHVYGSTHVYGEIFNGVIYYCFDNIEIYWQDGMYYDATSIAAPSDFGLSNIEPNEHQMEQINKLNALINMTDVLDK